MPIQIVLAEDHKIVLDGLCTLLGQNAEFEVVGVACGGREAVRLATTKKPDVVVMDIRMPELNGIDAARLILTAVPTVKILALSMHADRHSVVEMFKAGATGYMLKDCACDELFHAIRAVMSGQMYLSPKITTGVMRDYILAPPQSEHSAYHVLSSREREVLQLLAEGHCNRDIATKLGISAKTVESHRSQVMNKLSLTSLPELTKYAIREGLTSVDF